MLINDNTEPFPDLSRPEKHKDHQHEQIKCWQIYAYPLDIKGRLSHHYLEAFNELSTQSRIIECDDTYVIEAFNLQKVRKQNVSEHLADLDEIKDLATVKAESDQRLEGDGTRQEATRKFIETSAQKVIETISKYHVVGSNYMPRDLAEGALISYKKKSGAVTVGVIVKIVEPGLY